MKLLPTVILALLGVVLWFVPGVGFSARLCLALACLWLLWLAFARWAERHPAGKRCKQVAYACVGAVVLVLGCLEGVILSYGQKDLSALPVDAIIVLGAGVNGETPSLALQTRIQAAETYMERHPDVPVVLTGGQGSGETITEAECMRRALWREADDAWNQRLLLEEAATSTAENMAFSKTLLTEAGLDTDTMVIGVVTNDFHLYRSRLLAQREGLSTVGVPAELPWWSLTANYYLREAFALVKTLIFH